jgi:hypothetical protein
VLIVGVTGGPNHGEHPLLITFIHFGVFYFPAGSWPEEIYNSYCKLLILCLFASIVGYGSSDYATGQVLARTRNAACGLCRFHYSLSVLSQNDLMTDK